MRNKDKLAAKKCQCGEKPMLMFDLTGQWHVYCPKCKTGVQAYKDMLIEWKNSLENAYESLPIGVKVLLPLLRKGWIAMDKSGNWYWYEKKPAIKDSRWETVESNYHILSAFNLEPAEDWQNSLMEVV